MADQPEEEFGAHMKRLSGHLDLGMAQAAQDYDAAREEAKGMHGDLLKQEQSLRQQVQAVDPYVERFLAKPGHPLDQRTARRCLKYLDLHDQLGQIMQARRMLHGSTLPAGAQQPGSLVGDPAGQ